MIQLRTEVKEPKAAAQHLELARIQEQKNGEENMEEAGELEIALVGQQPGSKWMFCSYII